MPFDYTRVEREREEKRCARCNFKEATCECRHCCRRLCESCIDEPVCANTLTGRHEANTGEQS